MKTITRKQIVQVFELARKHGVRLGLQLPSARKPRK